MWNILGFDRGILSLFALLMSIMSTLPPIKDSPEELLGDANGLHGTMPSGVTLVVEGAQECNPTTFLLSSISGSL